MKAVISSTYDDFYWFFTPIVLWSWKKIGIDGILITPCYPPMDAAKRHKALLAMATCAAQSCYPINIGFEAPDDKKATYAQCARLYASEFPTLKNDEILVTGDIDMAVFNKDYFNQANNGLINVFGADLVPPDQYPICYISMPVSLWREVMWITPGVPIQQYLDELLGHLECEHFKGNYWAKDQETIYNKLNEKPWPVVKHLRAKHPHSFATHRADRDGWPDSPPPGIIDAHLPRPGYTDENFTKILKIFQDIYPEENFDWMIDYRNEYIKLI